jgi:hypothetical protein
MKAMRSAIWLITLSKHNVYLMKPDEAFPPEHPRNRDVISTKGYHR